MVSLLGYTGMRPEEVLALECPHIGQKTVLIEQKVSLGEIIAGQKTTRPPRSPKLFAAVRGDIEEPSQPSIDCSAETGVYPVLLIDAIIVKVRDSYGAARLQ